MRDTSRIFTQAISENMGIVFRFALVVYSTLCALCSVAIKYVYLLKIDFF